MSDQLPYNNNQWNDVPVPDSDLAWQKMELLLEKKKKRRIAWWFWPTAIALIAGLLIGGGLWIYGGNDHEPPANNKITHLTDKKVSPVDSIITIIHTQRPRTITDDKQNSTTRLLSTNKKDQATIMVMKERGVTDSLDKKTGKKTSLQHHFKKGQPVEIMKGKQVRHYKASVKEDDIIERSILIQSNTGNKQKPRAKTDNTSLQKDTAAIKDSSKTLLLKPAPGDSSSKKTKKEKAPVLSAGIGLPQYITLAGQQASPYNYNGNKNFFTDHLPSLYVRWQHNKWYAQAEVAYIVAQPVRKFFFSETTQIDSAANTSHTERFSVQKLYYHQLALNINRVILPKWSVGVGGMYNLLAGSVRAKQTTDKKINTGEETMVEKIEPVMGSRDSLLVRNKSVVGVLLQTDYQWKRFTIGLRYTKSLQPYIRYYTLVNERKEKNQTLEATLRFRLWKGR